MPLYKRKPFALVEKPENLKPQELIFQIRFTKEIFRNYEDYLKRIKLYRQKIWTCKATGKSNLTYEDALSSEKKASERFQSIPLEYVAPVYNNVQYSMLNLKDLVKSIATRLQGPFLEGDELCGRKEGRLRPCKIIKVVEDANGVQYEISWLGSDVTNEKTLLNSDELSAKNPPFSKRTLKAFIKDSTYRSLPWVLHDNLAKKHGISTEPPLELNSEISFRDGLVVFNRKRKKVEDVQTSEAPSDNGLKVYIRKKCSGEMSKSFISGKYANRAVENANLDSSSIKYPIDGMLVRPDIEDRHLRERPSPCRVFSHLWIVLVIY